MSCLFIFKVQLGILWMVWVYYDGKDFEVSSADCLFVGVDYWALAQVATEDGGLCYGGLKGDE